MVDQFDEIIEPILSASDLIKDKYELSQLYANRGDDIASDEVLQTIPGLFNLNATQLSYHNDYLAFKAVLSTWKSTNKNLLTLDQNDIDFLESFALKNNGIECLPRSLLILNNVEGYLPPIYVPESSNPIGLFPHYSGFVQPVVNDTKEEVFKPHLKDSLSSRLLLFPNPTNSEISVKYEINRHFVLANLQVLNLNGVVLMDHFISGRDRNGLKKLDVSFLPEGRYFCRLLVNGDQYAISSFTIDHE